MKRLNRACGIVSVLPVVAFAGSYVRACLWSVGRVRREPINFEDVSAREFARRLASHEDRAFWERTRDDIESHRLTDPYVDNRNDLAVALIHLGADFRGEDETQQPKRLARDHLGHQKSLADIEAALEYQLHERLEFVKPPDPVVADLLFDLSNVLALTRTSEHANAIHELSLSYNPVQEVLVSIRQGDKSGAQKSLAQTPAPCEGLLFYVALGVAALLTSAGFYVFVRRRRLQGV